MPKPTAIYPGAIVTDSRLTIASNRLTTTLAAGIGAADVTMTVASATGIVVNSLLSIYATTSSGAISGSVEIVFVSGVSGTTLTVQRGFDSTAAAVHAAGSAVAGFVDAWHHNAVVAEVEAIETALGVNLANISGTWTPASAYNFAAQTPGGSLIVGANVITLSPVPTGVNGADTHHMLYISGGTGVAEPVLIVGGTGVAGDASGTVIVTCANTHSGAWTIKSATAGLQEAVVDKGVGCKVVFGAGAFDFYGTFWTPGSVSVQGAGIKVTTLQFHSLNTKMFDLERDYFYLSDLKLLQVGTATSGSIGIYQAGAGSGVSAAACNAAIFQNVWVEGFHKGIYLAGSGQSLDLSHVTVYASVSDGITALSSQGYWNAVIVELNGGNGVTNGNATPGGGWTPFISGLQTYGNAGWGFYSTSFIQIGDNSFFNNDQLGGIYNGLTGSPTAGYVVDSYVQYEGIAYSGAPWSTNTTAPGIGSAASASPLTISNVDFYNNEGNAIECNGDSWKIIDNRVAVSGAGGVSGHLYGLLLSARFAMIEGNFFNGDATRIDGNFNTIIGNKFIGTTAIPLLNITTGQYLIFDANWFEQAGAGTAYTLAAGVIVGEGRNTIFAGTATNSATRDSSNASTVTFWDRPIGADVASGSSITPTAQVFHVTGTTTVQNILLPTGTVNPYLTVIPAGLFVTGTSGNIAIATTAVVGKAIYYQYDSGTSKWYPSY